MKVTYWQSDGEMELKFRIGLLYISLIVDNDDIDKVLNTRVLRQVHVVVW
jgi:hypothetical protein